ncbi:MAG: GvpL/GvpF family gas vesicle protein [Limnospira sp.]
MYVYAFLKTPRVPLKLPRGIENPVDLLKTDDLSALVEPNLGADNLPQTDDEELMRAVLAHDRVLRELFEQTTVLPLRFGTCFPSEARLLEHMASERDRYSRQLEQLGGRAEYLLRGVPRDFSPQEPPTEPEPTTGRAYFLEKKRRHQRQLDGQRRQTREWEQFLDAIGYAYPNWIHAQPQGGTERIYILIDRDRESALIEWLHQQQQNTRAWDLNLSRALPPYHFL